MRFSVQLLLLGVPVFGDVTISPTDSDFDEAVKHFQLDLSDFSEAELVAYKLNFERHMREDFEKSEKLTKNPLSWSKHIEEMLRESAPVQTEKRVKELQKHLKQEKATWWAEWSPRWVDNDKISMTSIKDAKYMQGSFVGDKMKRLEDVYSAVNMTIPVADLPKNFDSRQEWGAKCPSLLHVRNQARCGSCWAHGSTESYNDRVCIATGKKELLSTEHTTSCCGFFPCWSMGCSGGHPGLAWRWLVKGGVVTGGDYGDSSEYCWPYEVDPNSKAMATTPPCRKTCKNKAYDKSFDDDRAEHAGGRAYMVHGIDAIRENIQKFGSVASAFIVFDDFMNYKGGVYTGPAAGAKPLGGHAIKIVGWGTTDEGMGYWIVANSWGTDWGEKGFFKIKWNSMTLMDYGVSAGEIQEKASMENQVYV